MDEELDITRLKYVLYARKSTIEDSRQVRSIPDQVRECLELAHRLGLTVVGKPVEEKGSAKSPNQRPLFSQIIKDINSGKYDGILSWNPDRLARNMLEGGLIINLIDEGILKDLKFVTHHFTNDANGKMLLGMAFVLSKQYSDDLSQKVTRGVRGRFQEGKSPVPKHGYVNEGGIYHKDPRTSPLIREAWEMRLRGESLKAIDKYLVTNGYYRQTKTSGRKIQISFKRLSDMFHDSFYYGVLNQANQQVDLREFRDFDPIVTEAEFNQIQLLSIRRLTPYNTNKRKTFYPLKGMVVCSYCGKKMVTAASSGQSKKYLYYRCDTVGCKRVKKSIRARILIDYIYDFFTQKFHLTQKDYQKYYSKLSLLADERRIKLRKQKNHLSGAIKALNGEIKDRSLTIGKGKLTDIVLKENEAHILNLVGEKDELSAELKKVESLLTPKDDDELSLKQFLNLINHAGVTIKSANAVQKDVICRLVFLNFTLDEQKVVSYRLKEPFKTMLKTTYMSCCRGDRIRTCGLTHPMRARYQLRHSP